MRWNQTIVICAVLVCLMRAASAQNDGELREMEGSGTLRLPVDEVVLTFNAEDAKGRAINDLKAGEIRVWDNGVAPRKIVAFDMLFNRPIRAGILLDTSGSMVQMMAVNKAIAEKFVQKFFRQQSDEAFVSKFGYVSEMMQAWTGDLSSLLRGVEDARASANTLRGTALFNAVSQACSSSFDKV